MDIDWVEEELLSSKFKRYTQELSFIWTENDLGVKVDIEGNPLEDNALSQFHVS